MAEEEYSITVSRTVRARADRVFEYLARPENHRALDTSGMIRGSRDQTRINASGTTFVMNMHNAVKGDHQVENHVVVYEPGRAIGWAPAEPGRSPAGHTWVWWLAPGGGGSTIVSQTYDWSRFTPVEMIIYLPVIDRDQLQRSLDRLALVVEDHDR